MGTHPIFESDFDCLTEMAASAVYILDLKGKVLISRNYRGDMPLNIIEKFPKMLMEAEEERTVPARPIRVESSRGPELMMAWSRIWTGFSPVVKWMISNECLMMRTVISFFPLLRPCIINEFTRRSTMGH